MVLEKSHKSPLDRKEIQPVHPKGDQSWLFIGRIDVEAETPILWPPDVKKREPLLHCWWECKLVQPPWSKRLLRNINAFSYLNSYVLERD